MSALHDVTPSALLEEPWLPLITLHFMFGESEAVCPMCAMWADGYNALMRHLKALCNFLVLTAGDPRRFAEVAEACGWDQLRLVSAGKSSVKRDFGVEDVQGRQLPSVSVYSRTARGERVHHYSASAIVAADEYRGMDLLYLVWRFFDLVPAGRGDWLPSNA